MAVAVVFGANGFIGRPIAAELARRGFEVAGAGLGAGPEGFHGPWFDVDLLAVEPDRVASILSAQRTDVVVNCTGAVSGDAQTLRKLNVDLTARLLHVTSVAARGRRMRFVHIGSAAEYGRGQMGIPVTESATAAPAGEYGKSKLAAARLVLAASGIEGPSTAEVDGVVLRVFNALGRGMPATTLAGAALARLADAVTTGAPTISMGPLDAVRDFVDVRDVAAAVAAACSAPKLPEGRIVNVASGKAHTARELVELIAAAAGFHGTIEERSSGSSRSSDVPWQVADVSLAARALGWRASYGLAESVRTMLQR